MSRKKVNANGLFLYNQRHSSFMAAPSPTFSTQAHWRKIFVKKRRKSKMAKIRNHFATWSGPIHTPFRPFDWSYTCQNARSKLFS